MASVAPRLSLMQLRIVSRAISAWLALASDELESSLIRGRHLLDRARDRLRRLGDLACIVENPAHVYGRFAGLGAEPG
jgi:hypothetical protein